MLWFLCVRFIALNNTNNTRNIYLYICKMNSTVIVDSWKKTTNMESLQHILF